MLAGAPGNRFGFQYSDYGAIPAAYGVSITPGASDAEGSWTEVATGSNIAEDIYVLTLFVTAGFISGASKNHLLDIGVDPAGGSSYTAIISDLVCSNSASFVQGGQWFTFPIFIKAGSSVAVRIQGSNDTAGIVRVGLVYYGRPSRPESIRTGTYSEAIGISGGTSVGTALTPGSTGSEGSWVSLGTTARDLWWWQVGFAYDDVSTKAQVVSVDLAYGDASNKIMLIENSQWAFATTAEAIHHPMDMFCYGEVPAGSTIYARAGSTQAPDASGYAAAVGIGG